MAKTCEGNRRSVKHKKGTIAPEEALRAKLAYSQNAPCPNSKK
jgi:hypothetical protein